MRVDLSPSVVNTLPGATPFPHVSVHIVESKIVGRVRTDNRSSQQRLLARLLTGSAIDVRRVHRERVAKGKDRLGSGTAGIFPFRLGRESVNPTSGDFVRQ